MIRIARWAFVLCIGFSGAATAASPKDFVTDALKGDNSEIMLGQYAHQHGGSAAMRDYGLTLSDDHSQAKREMATVAAKVGVAVPSNATVEAMAERVKLAVLSGKTFDREFARYMVEDHQSDIAKFKAEARAHDGPVSKIAADQLHALEKHLRMAQDLANGP
jgi:putative membrane protein